jgi:hypothetical protein
VQVAIVLVTASGEVSEWLKEHAWKVCIRSNVSRVRIPLSPPTYQDNYLILNSFTENNCDWCAIGYASRCCL